MLSDRQSLRRFEIWWRFTTECKMMCWIGVSVQTHGFISRRNGKTTQYKSLPNRTVLAPWNLHTSKRCSQVGLQASSLTTRAISHGCAEKGSIGCPFTTKGLDMGIWNALSPARPIIVCFCRQYSYSTPLAGLRQGILRPTSLRSFLETLYTTAPTVLYPWARRNCAKATFLAWLRASTLGGFRCGSCVMIGT